MLSLRRENANYPACHQNPLKMVIETSKSNSKSTLNAHEILNQSMPNEKQELNYLVNACYISIEKNELLNGLSESSKKKQILTYKKPAVLFDLSKVTSKLQPMETNIHSPSSILLVPHLPPQKMIIA